MTDEEYLERLKGLRASSGKRPESLNQSRNVNAPLQLARGWTAGLLGLPGDIEGLVRMLPGIENETPVLPTSDFYREYLPGYDPAPAARAISGLGALAGGVGATKVAGAAVKGAKATGKALGPKAAEMAEGYLQSAGLAPSVIKPKGGNWLSGSVEGATGPLKGGMVAGQTPAERIPLHEALLQDPTLPPESVETVRRQLDRTRGEDAINNWIDTKLNKYIRNEMATPEDPVRKLAERGVLHVDPEILGVNRWRAPQKRTMAGGEQLGQSEAAKIWEDSTDVAINTPRAGEMAYPSVLEKNPWLTKLDPEQRVYALNAAISHQPEVNGLGFDHLIDELRNATRADSDLPANLRWKPEDLKKVTIEQAVERVAKINEYRAAKKAEANEVLARNPATAPYKDYETVPGTQEPNSKGLSWKQIRAAEMPEDFVAPERYEIVRPTPSSETLAIRDKETGKYITTGLESEEQARKHLSETLGRKQLEDALKYEGEVMGHCVGGYCDDVLEGRSQIYSLRDKKGEPHVTIEVAPLEVEQAISALPSNERKVFLQEIKDRYFGGRTPTMNEQEKYFQLQEQEYFRKYGAPPPDIVQIKGKGNAAPKAEYLPFVQDFVRSGNWSKVGDLKNTGLMKLGNQYLPKEEVGPLVERASRFIEETPALREHREAQRAYENYTGPVPSAEYTALQRAAGKQVHPTIPYTYRELRAILDDPDAFADRNTDALGPNLERIERLRQLVGEKGYAEGGFVQDTEAQPPMLDQMRLEMMDRGYAGGGLIKALKGAKAARDATKAVTVAEKSAPAIPTPPRVQALEKARKNAIKAGQSTKESERMLQQGYEPDWYHGTTGDIKALEKERLGQATGAESAKKAFFFVRDPSTPPPEMLEKTRDPKSIDMMKKLGFSDEELAKLNEVSMKGHGAETASGYSQIGGSREYNEAMRKANAAERAGNWSEYEKWMQVAEDAEIGRNQGLQDLVAKYGEARDVMLDRINNAVLNKPLPQQEAEALDAKMKQLMPYGWYNSYSIPQLRALKGEIVKLAGPDSAAPALQSIDDFISVKANRMLEETYQEGSNVMPVALRYKNPMYYDFGGSTYRDQSYSDLIDQARAGGHDALIIKNTFDPGAGPAKLIDVAAVFKPEQVRSRFAAFDPARINENDILGVADPALLAGTAVASGIGLGALGQVKKRKLEQPEQKKAAGGLAKLLKGAKTAEEAAKASSKAHPTVFPPVAPLTQAEMRPIAQRIAEQMTEEFVRPNPKLSKNPANKTRKTFEREKDLPVETVQRIEPKPAPVMDYEQMQGGYLVGVPGDPTLGGVATPGTLESVHQGAVELRRLGDVEFGQNPTGAVQLFGGPRYGSFDDRFWASNLGPAQAIQNRATELGELGPVYGQYIKMAPPSTNFALHNLDALLAYQEPEKLSKTKLEQLNREIRKGSPKYGKFPGFAGFEDPIDVLLQAQMNSDLRKHIAETLMKPDTTNALGLRPGSDVLFGITTPSLRNLETGVSGYSIGKLEPGVELMPSLHPTYDYDIPGMFLGQSKYPVPYEIAFPRSTAYTRANLKPGAQEFNTLKMIGAREEIDPQYIDQIKMYEELMKEYTGKKEGGLVKPEGAEDFAKQIMAKIANNPVSARDGNRISD